MSENPTPNPPHTPRVAAVIFAWLVVGIPAAWGIFNTIRQATLLFK